MHRLCSVAATLLLLAVTTLQAQQHSRGFEPWNAHADTVGAARTVALLRLTSVQIPRRDYRYEGLAVGAIALGALGAWVGSQLTLACPTVPGADCGPDRLGNAVALGLTSAAVGGGLGYLVGRLSSKPEPPNPRRR